MLRRAALTALVAVGAGVASSLGMNHTTVGPDEDPVCEGQGPVPDKYIVLLDASEQMNKNIAVVAEVAFWAKTLRRTFVEPVYCDSRVASPFNQTRDAGFNVSHWAADMSRLAHKQLTDRHWTCDEEKEPFGAVHDLTSACRHVPIISSRRFVDLVKGRPELTTSVTFHVATFSERKDYGGKNRVPEDSSSKVLYVSGFARAVTTAEIVRGACTKRASDCFGFAFGVAKPLIQFATRTAAQAKPYTCVEWRAETSRAAEMTEHELGQGGPVKLIKCATQIYARTRDAWRAEKRVFRDAPPTVLVLRLRR